MPDTLPISVSLCNYNEGTIIADGYLKTITLNASSYEFICNIHGHSFHIIYGKYINGWYLCVPDWCIGVELSHPDDTFWNRESLLHAGVDENTATILIAALKITYKHIS